MSINHARPNLSIALLPWGNVIEDFLESIDLSLEEFCQEMTGGWLFGYIEALKLVDIATVLICISATVTVPTRRVHKPTGAVIWLIPASPAYLWIHQRLVNPYGWTVEATFGRKKMGMYRPWFICLREIAPYLSTPLKSLSQILKQENCQAILCQEYEYARFDLCTVLGKLLNIPVFASFQGGNFQLTKLEKLGRKFSINACEGVIVATNSEIERLQKHYSLSRAKIAQIFNPLDLSVWQSGDRTATRTELGIPLDAQVVVWHGRIDLHRKGLDILIEAWQKVSNHHPKSNFHLLLVGTGNDAATLHQKIEQMQLPRVHWLDEYILDRQRICNYLKAADIYTLPSRHEGFPVAPLEAMACGLPIVATEVSGIPDILEDNENSGGIRVPCENSTQLALAIERLLEDRELRQLLGENARQRLETHFSLLSVGQKLRNLLFTKK